MTPVTKSMLMTLALFAVTMCEHVAALTRPPSLQASAPATVDANRSFRRAKLLDIFETVTAKDVINVLGRWQTYKQWDSVGPLREMDQLFDENWQPKKPLPVAYPSFFNSRRVDTKAAGSSAYLASVKEFEAKGANFKSESKNYRPGEKNDPRPTPQRRGWAKRNRQVQRYWHAQNIDLLPFTSKPLAACIGCTVAEMNAMPISPRACDVVFDALSRSQSGITEQEFCDERRAAWQAADGSFDADAFESDLNAGRRTIAQAYFLFPGLPFILSNLVWYSPKVNGLKLTEDFVAQQAVMVAKNAELWADVLNK
mmetsp:Transcript_5001/g.9720  ORF Transcript_5001/g.9720 Transcript_5001/m.9720 type:complete len:312 (-) Transcript_5001:147-1082(-)